MKLHGHMFMKFGYTCILSIMALVLAGCSTTSKVDWDSRFGTYTYAMALDELGSPDRIADMPDGSKTAEWIRKHGTTTQSTGMNTTRYEPEEGPGRSSAPARPDLVLQLSFAPDGTLVDWNRNY